MKKAVLTAAILLSLVANQATALEIDPTLPDYRAVDGISGTLRSVGSDTLSDLMRLWAEGFKARYPEVAIEIEGKGSATAPAALIAGTAQLAPMSRPMLGLERADFTARYGYPPISMRGAVDALAVFVHKDNPIECLSLPQVDAIFSKTRKAGHESDIRAWGDLGLGGDWATRPIALYGRHSTSGTYGYFKDVALLNGDYKDMLAEQPGSAEVAAAVGADLGGIGYAGIGYVTPGVRAVPLRIDADADCFPATADNANSGDYPLARFLYLYVNKNPREPLDPLRAELIRFIDSKQGQEIVIKEGYSPIINAVAQDDLKALGLLPDPATLHQP